MRAILLLMTVTMTIAAPVEGQDAGRCVKNCRRQNLVAQEARVEIDANTGAIAHGSTRFPEGTNVHVIIVNKNPFKYSYRVTHVSALLEPAIAAAFLGLVPDLAPALQQLRAATGVAPAADACTGDERTLVEEVSKAAAALDAVLKPAQEGLKPRQAASERYNAFVTATANDSAFVAANDSELSTVCRLCEDAKAVLDSLDRLIDLDDLPKQAERVKAAANALETTIAEFNAKAKDKTCKANMEEALRRHQETLRTGQAVAKAIEDLQKNKASFEQMKKIITAALAQEYPINQPFSPQTLGGPTGITVTIFRTNLREADAKEQQVAAVFIQVGESRLSLSGGVGYSTVDDVRIGRVAANVPGAEGKPTLGNRFGFVSKSGGKPVVLTALNGHFDVPYGKDRRVLKLAGTAGVVFRNAEAAGQQVEFILGGAWRFAGNNLFLTAGVHYARVEELAGPGDDAAADVKNGFFKIGDPVPAALTDPLPVRKDWKPGFIAALTFRLR